MKSQKAVNILYCLQNFSHFLSLHSPSCKQVRVMNTPLHPTLYSKTGVYRGIHFFLIFALKHRSWVLVRTAIYVLSKIKKYLTFFHMKITIFTAVKYCSILHGHVCVMRSIFDPTNEVFMQQHFLQGIRYIKFRIFCFLTCPKLLHLSHTKTNC